MVILLALDDLPKNVRNNPYNPFPRILHFPIEKIGNVDKCREWSGSPCKTVRFTSDPGVDSYSLETLVNYIIEQSQLDESEFERMESIQSLESHIQKLPNTTTNALIFHKIEPTNYNYTIMFNASSDAYVLLAPGRKPDNRNELQIAVDKAIFRFHKDVFVSNRSGYTSPEDLDITINKRRYPQLGYKGGQRAIEDAGPVFYYCGMMFQFVVLLYNICSEKDLKLRQGLRNMGLMDSVYWTSWYLTSLLIFSAACAILISTGELFDVKFFSSSDASVIFVIFFVFSMSVTSLAIFSSIFLKKAKASLNSGILNFVLGLLIVSLVSRSSIKDSLRDHNLVWPWVSQVLSMLFPAYNLGEAMCEINKMVKNNSYVNWSSIFDRRLRNSTVNASSIPLVFEIIEVPSINDSLNLMLINFLTFGILAFYFDQIIDKVNGEPCKWYEPFTPSFWGFHSTRKSRGKNEVESTNSEGSLGFIEESQPLLYSLNFPRLIVASLSKNFRQKSSGKIIRAVNDVSYESGDGEILALLGHNGSGKTTTINLIIGMLKPDEGKIYIDGMSVITDIARIRSIIGICPQHDILWDELNPIEHMNILFKIKGIKLKDSKAEIDQLLYDVRLDNCKGDPVGTFSGGMKRRLSVALAFLSCNKVVILDEPTTGLDPYVRRDIWNLIHKMKRGRVILMTTHSMDEADVLADKIVVMKNGQIQAEGKSMKLKSLYGGYYMLLEVHKPESMPINILENEVVHTISDIISPECSMISKSTTNRKQLDTVSFFKFKIPAGCNLKIIDFFDRLQNPGSIGCLRFIKNCSLTQTTLEDVFLKLSSG